jgi:hypothetical protein
MQSRFELRYLHAAAHGFCCCSCAPVTGNADEKPSVDSFAFDVAVVSDVLFIALRDGLTAPLRSCLAQLVDCCRCVIFGFEERLIEEEEEFMQTLRSSLAHVPVNVVEIRRIEPRKEGTPV